MKRFTGQVPKQRTSVLWGFGAQHGGTWRHSTSPPPRKSKPLSSFGGLGVVLSEILVVLARPDTSLALPRPISSPGPHTAARLRSFPPLLPVSFEFQFLRNPQIFRRKKGRVWRGDRASLFHSVP